MKRICIWASDEKVIHIFSKLLQDTFHVWGSSSREAVQRQIVAQPPDLLLLDLDQLSEDEYFDTWFSSLPHTHQCPRMCVASRSTLQVKEHVWLSQSSIPLLEKPLRQRSFLNCVQSCIAPEDVLSSHSELSSPSSSNLSDPSFSLRASSAQRATTGGKIGSVVLKEEIGRGGMGIVFKGFQETLERDVAVKMILPELVHQPSVLLRLQREALAIARLNHPHIVRIFDAGFTEENVFYITMEWLSGVDLEVKLKQQGKFLPADALRIVLQIAKGLVEAHSKGIVHRDIKPSNILLSQNGHATLTDFGLAFRTVDARLTSDGFVMGTADYLAPEQITAGQIDRRTDIYCLGMVLFEMLAGHVPFPSANVIEVLRSQVEQNIPDLREGPTYLSEDVWFILSMMTRKDPTARFQSCEELVHFIEQTLDSLHVQGNWLDSFELPQADFVPDSHSGSNPMSSTPPPPSGSLFAQVRESSSSLLSPAFHHSEHIQQPLVSTPLPYSMQSGDSFLESAGEDYLQWSRVKQLTLSFSEQMGPMAKWILKKECKHLGFTPQRIPVQRLEHLLERLSRHLEGDKKRTFMAKAKGELLP